MSSEIKNTALKAINMADNVITRCVQAVEEAMKNDAEYQQMTTRKGYKNFRSIEAYGDMKEPLFNASQIYYYVNPNITCDRHIGRFYKSFDENEIVIKQKVILPAKTNDKLYERTNVVNLLTKQGVLKAIFAKKNPSTFHKLFKKFIMALLDTMYEKHRESLEQTLQEQIEEYKRIQKEDQAKIDRHEKTIFYAQDIAKTFTSHIRYADHELFGDEQDELEYLHDQYYNKVDVYLVDADYVNMLPRPKKKAKKPRKKNEIEIESDTESDSESLNDPYGIVNSQTDMKETESRYNVSYEKGFYEYTLIEKDTLESSDVMFYTIKPLKSQKKSKPKNSKWVASIDVLNTEHYKNIQNVLKANASQTHLKSVIACKLEDIFDARNRGLSDILRNAKREKIARVREARRCDRSLIIPENPGSFNRIFF